MLQKGVISPVTAPTEWCTGIVPVLKPNGSVSICVDLAHCNKAVSVRYTQNLRTLLSWEILPKLDANSGFCQIPLDDK